MKSKHKYYLFVLTEYKTFFSHIEDVHIYLIFSTLTPATEHGASLTRAGALNYQSYVEGPCSDKNFTLVE